MELTQNNNVENLDLDVVPENGSVVIIDDQPDEALPILRALSKRGIASTYYRGNIPSDLPETPKQFVRVVFLDLQLIETADEHQISKSVVNVLTKIIPEENGPFIGKVVQEEIMKFPHLIPSAIINFNKRDCLEEKVIPLIDEEEFISNVSTRIRGLFNEEEEEKIQKAISSALNDEFKTVFEAKAEAIEIIEQHIKTELSKAGSFHLFVIWENLTKKSAAKLVKSVSELVTNDENWETNMRNVFKRMGVARVGKNEYPMDMLIKESINTLNTSFIDSLESEVKSQKLPGSITLDSDTIITEKIGGNNYALKREGNQELFTKNNEKIGSGESRDGLIKSITKNQKIDTNDKESLMKLLSRYNGIPCSLNTKLHIETNPSQELVPGNLYLIDGLDTEKKRQYLSTFFKIIPEDISDFNFIDLEVSPICDYAQNKWKRSRTLPGIIYPISQKDSLKSGNNFYSVEPTFELTGKVYRMAFDFHLFNALDKVIAKERQVKYRLKRELLLDIIAQLSAHVNRPGISFIS
jgi:hypothetical protein